VRRLNPEAMKSTRDFALTIAALEKRLQRLERTASLARSSIEGDAIYAYDVNEAATMVIGGQYDGTNAAAVLTGPTPPQPSPPIVSTAPGGLNVEWDGFYADIDAVSPMDFLRVDIAVGNTQSFDPIATPPSTAIVSPRGGSAFISLPPGLFYVAFVARTYAGVPSEPSVLMPGEVTESAVVTAPPAASPTPTVTGGIDSITVSWPNAAYSVEVHVSQSPSFTPTLGDRTTFVAASDGTSVTVIRMPNGASLNYTSAYYVRTIAYNDGGAAPPSPAVTGSLQPGALQLNEGGTTKTTRLRVTSSTDVDPNDPLNEPPLVVGDATARHIRMDGNELVGMFDATRKGLLGLQGTFFTGWDYGVARITTDADGEDFIAHTIGAVPTIVVLSTTVVGEQYEVRLAARSTAQFRVRARNTANALAPAGTQIDVHWIAILASA
jgi:hypothetical protein